MLQQFRISHKIRHCLISVLLRILALVIGHMLIQATGAALLTLFFAKPGPASELLLTLAQYKSSLHLHYKDGIATTVVIGLNGSN